MVRVCMEWPMAIANLLKLISCNCTGNVLHSDAPVGKIMPGASQFVGTAMAHYAERRLDQAWKLNLYLTIAE